MDARTAVRCSPRRSSGYIERTGPTARAVGWTLFLLLALSSFGCSGGLAELHLFPESHRGTISSDRVWTGLHRVSGDLSVRGDLQIRCGTHIQVADGAEIEVRRGGRLRSAGRAGCPVVWTSVNEVPSPGDWGGIEVREGGRLVASRTTFEFGGSGGAMLQVRAGGAIQLDGATLAHAAGGGIDVRPDATVRRANRVEFVDVARQPIRMPVGQVGRLDRPSFVSTPATIVALGGVIDEPVQWDFPFQSIEIVGDVHLRARTIIREETRVRLYPDTTVRVEEGGALRTLGDGRLSYQSSRRWVHVSFGPESRLEIASTAGPDSLFRWTLFSGPGELDVADQASVRIHRSKVFEGRCPSRALAERDGEGRRNCG